MDAQEKDLGHAFLIHFCLIWSSLFFPISTRVIFPMFAQGTSIVLVATSILIWAFWMMSGRRVIRHTRSITWILYTYYKLTSSPPVSFPWLLWVVFTWLCYVIQTLQVVNDNTNFCHILSVLSMKPVSISYTLSHPNSFYISFLIFLYVLVWYYSK